MSSLVSLGVGLLGLFFVPWASLVSVLDFWSLLDFRSCWGFLDLGTAPVLGEGPTTVSKFAVSHFCLDVAAPVLDVGPTFVSKLALSSFRLDVGLISVCSSSECVGLRFLLDEACASTESPLSLVRAENLLETRSL